MFARRIRRPRRRAIWSPLVLALVLPIAISQWSPLFARLIVGPEVHACHCDRRGSEAECACPICSPGRDDLLSDDIAVRGSCGDDALPAPKAVAMPFVLPAPSQRVAYSERAARVVPVDLPRDEPAREPATPPPRHCAVLTSR